MIDTGDPAVCCGCMACGDICPVGAITSSLDDNGFLMPSVDAEKCVACEACTDICAFRHQRATEQNIKAAYSFKLTDQEGLKRSTSGGAFTALSDIVLSEGGVIVGAVLDDYFSVVHRAADDPIGRDAMRLSKYAQSHTEGIFSAVQQMLSDGKKVMFVGTPCQCGEMRRFIGESENLLVCDFLCHGVPSEAFFKDHIRYLEEYYHKKASSYTFRSKRYGWNHGIEEIVFSNGSRKDAKRVQAYAHFFQSGVSLRESCRNCVYRSLNRPSDLTIADFWGIEKITGKTDKEGVSLIFVNSRFGESFVARLKGMGELTAVPTESVLYRVSTSPAKSRIDVAEFWNSYHQYGYAGLVDRYAPLSLKSVIKHEMKKRLN